jgi:hypothetical protein
MKYTKYVDPDDLGALEFEVISQELKIYLTRILESKILSKEFPENNIIRQNGIINKARNIAGLPIYVLEADEDGEYQPTEHAWHNGEFQLTLRRLTTIQFIEIIGDLIKEDVLDVDQINDSLDRDNSSFRYKFDDEELIVEVIPIDEIQADMDQAHPNIRLVVTRMNEGLERGDYPSVLQSSAVIFETMAKDIVSIPSVQNQTLKGFFERYRKESLLPNEILDFILKVYESRSTEPLAAHGSTKIPTISRENAIVISEMTKAFVRIEYTLQKEMTVKT